MQDCPDSGVVSDWLTKGQTVLIQKDKLYGLIIKKRMIWFHTPGLWSVFVWLVGVSEQIKHFLSESMKAWGGGGWI